MPKRKPKTMEIVATTDGNTLRWTIGLSSRGRVAEVCDMLTEMVRMLERRR